MFLRKLCSCLLIVVAVVAGILLFPRKQNAKERLPVKDTDYEMTLHAYQYRINLI